VHSFLPCILLVHYFLPSFLRIFPPCIPSFLVHSLLPSFPVYSFLP
jgi:hypothetical protein